MAASITILRTSRAGAHLITDGARVAWIMPRQRRDDGTFTAGAYEALARGKTVAEHEAAEVEYRKAQVERERVFQEGKLPMTFALPAERVSDYSEKAWKVRSDSGKLFRGRWYWEYKYLPKSLVDVSFVMSAAVLKMPRWFFEKNEWLKGLN